MAANINIPDGFEIENKPLDIPQGFELEYEPKTDKNYNGAVIENYNPNNKIYDPYSLLNKFKECLEWVQRTPFSAYQEGKNQVEIADLEMKTIYPRAGQSENDKKRLDYLSSQIPKNYNIYEPKYKQKDPVTITGVIERTPYHLKKGYVEAARMTPMLLETIKAGGIGSAAGAILGAGGSFALGQAGANTFLPDEILTMPTMALAGARWGGGINAARRTFELEAGLAKNELRQINNEILSNGGKPLSDDEINLLAIGVGGVNAGLEMVSLKPVLKTVPGGKEILAQFEKKQLKELAANKTLRAKLTEVLKDYGQGLAWESGTEMVQEAVNIVADEYARKLGGIEATPLNENVARVLETGAATFGAMIFLGGVGSFAQTAKILTMQGISEKAAKVKAENMTSEERHNFIDNNFGSLVASIKDLSEVKELEKQEKYSEAKRLVSDDISRQMIDVGRDEQEAQRLGELASVIYDKIAQGDIEGKTAYDIYNKYNVTIRDGVQMNVMPEEKAEAEIFNQPLDLSVDLNQKITVLDLSNRFKSNPTKDEVKTFINKIAESKEPIPTLSKDWMIDILNKSNKKHHLINSSQAGRMSKQRNNRHKKALMSLDELVKNSVFIETVNNTKADKKPNVEMYHYFYTPIKLGDKTYIIKLVSETLKNEKTKNVTLEGASVFNRQLKPQEGNNTIITDAKPVFNTIAPKTVHLYDIIELNSKSNNSASLSIKEMLKGIKDAQGNTYYQSQNTDNVRGSISFLKDDEGNIRQSVIDLVSGKADKSTMLHEFSHLFLQTLILESENNIKARDMLLSVNKWLKSNDKEYTRAQHEKFAQGFEAYVMSGKAPTSKLKQVFEKFAQWLRDIYTALEHSEKIKLSPEAKKVFDNLFADEDFEEQKKKSKDIIDKAKYYAQAMYEPTEEQLRYKQVAYNILVSATNRNKKWLQMVLGSSSNTRAMQKKKERIYDALDKVDDKINLNGFDPSWLEFFSDKGVSYYDDEVGAGYTLAREAYDVIVNRTWLKTNEEYYELQEAQLQYEYILKEYEKAKRTEDRTIVLLAYYDWLETVPEIVHQDYGYKWIHDTNEIERFEHLNKFEQAKETLLKRADMLKNQNGVEEYKNVVNNLLKSLDFLSYSDRNKILNKISSVKNVEELKNNIDEIMDFAQCVEDMSTRRDISERIQDELRSTKNVRTNGRTRGKYDYSTNKLFEKLRDINRLNVEQADTLYAQLQEEFSAMSEDERETMSFEDKLIRKFTTYKAYGQKYISSDFLSDLYADIVFSKMQGRLAKDETDFNKRIENQRAVDNVLNRLEKKREAKGITKLYAKFANLESFLNLFLDKNFVDEYSILYEETQVQTKSYLEKQEILKNISNILNVKPFFIDDKIFEKLNEKYIFKDYSLKRPKNIELNKMQLIEAYIYSKTPLIMDRLINMFGLGGFDRIMSLLTPEDRQIGDILQRAAGRYYTPVNQIYIKKYGIDMPKAKNYFPVHADIVRELDMFNQYSEQSTSPGFTKSRSDSGKIPIKLTNPIQTLFNHIEKANSLILLEEKLSKLNKVFKDRTVTAFIEEKYGEDAYEEFLKQITDSSYTKRSERLSAMDNIINKMVNNVIGATITLKPKITATQLVSVINFADKMPATTWLGGFLKALATPRKTIKFMMSNDYLKQRFGEGAQNEALARIVKASNFAKSKKFIDFFSLNVKLGDIGAIIFGGKPYVDYLMSKKGLSLEEAFKEFVLEVNRAQQAATTSSLSTFQRSNNPIFRLYYAYQNTTNQYFRKAADAIISHANGDISKKEMVKTILIYTVFNNFLYRMVANPYVWILGLSAGEWDEFAKEAILSIFDINSSAIMFFGNIYQAILNSLLEKPVLNSNRALEKIPKDINKILLEAQKYDLENIELDTWLNAIGDILDTSTGIPASTLINMGSAAGDFAQGEIGLGVMKLSGYSDYQAKKAFNIKD